MGDEWRFETNGRTRVYDMGRWHVLGIVNMTPDSFSDGGAFGGDGGEGRVLSAVESMLCAGAIGVDIGAESTRPGAMPVAPEEQIRRSVGAIALLRRVIGDEFLISIDTTSSVVARAAIEAGADVVNDVSGGRDDDEMFRIVAKYRAGCILMHRELKPAHDVFSTQYGTGTVSAPVYQSGVIAAVRCFLEERVAAAGKAGIPSERIVVDPGLGFGKSVADNLMLLRETGRFAALGCAVMSGLSRKSFVGFASGVPAERPARERGAGTIALSVMHLVSGARLFRVHDVREHVEALSAAWAIIDEERDACRG